MNVKEMDEIPENESLYEIEMNEPIMTRHDETATERERQESNLKSKQATRIT